MRKHNCHGGVKERTFYANESQLDQSFFGNTSKLKNFRNVEF